MNTTFSRLLLTKTPLSAALLALLLAGCASTQSNYASKGVLLEDGSYYFPARDGQGDYYYGQPRRESDYAFEFGIGSSPFWGPRHCFWSSWHCSYWPYDYRYGFGHGHYFDARFGWTWHGGRHDPWYRSFRGHPTPRMRLQDGPDAAPSAQRPRVDSRQPAPLPRRIGADEKPLPGNRGRQRWTLSSQGDVASTPEADEAPATQGQVLGREREEIREPRAARREPSPRPVREAGNDRIRERSHERDD